MGTPDKVKAQSVGVTTIPSEYDNCNIFGQFFHTWVWRFLVKYRGQDIRPEDLHRCPKSSNSALIGEKLELYWNEHVKKCEEKGKTPFLFWPVLRLYGPFYFFIMVICWIGYFFQIVQAICMGNLMEYVGKYKDASIEDEQKNALISVYLYGTGIVLSQLFLMLCINPFFFHASIIGMNVRVACCSLIYRKALRLSKTAFMNTSVGNIVNLLSNDTSRFDFFVLHTPFFFYGPASVLIVIWILWPYLNYTTIYGIAILLLYIPLQTFMGKQFSKLRAQAAQLTDERVRLMNEYIPAMRVIKMYAWESQFSQMINLARKREISKIKRSAFLRALNISLFYVSAKVIIFLIFSIWVLKGNYLNAKTVFLTFALMNHVRISTTLMMPNAISFGGEGLISMKRITAFLKLPERQDSSSLNRSNFVVKGIDIDLNIENLNASYADLSKKHLSKLTNGTAKVKSRIKITEKKSVEFSDKNGVLTEQNALENINLNCKPGELTIIVGPVGSGKSSILLSVLGELFINKGQIDVKGRISYSSQEAWTFAGTVKDNIMFNSIYDPEKYREVVRVCALERDMALFPQNDRTLIGDRGVSLSGGQRARINLTRALYLDADIYLLDDPLSAVDAHVAKHIFEEAIRGYLAKKVVILVTHQLQFIKSANKILLIKNGQQIACGDYNSLLSSLNNKLDFSEFIGVDVDQNKQDKQQINYRTVSMNSDSSVCNPTGSLLSLSSSLDYDNNLEGKKSATDLIDNDQTNHTGERVLKKESQSLTGSWRAYGVYIKMGSSWWVGPLLIFVFVISQGLFSGSDYWLSLWTDSQQRLGRIQLIQNGTESNLQSSNSTNLVDRFTTVQNVEIYSMLMFSLFMFSLFRGTVFFLLCMRSSVRLHNRLFNTMVRAPMSFFELNPIGQILNRFSRDTGVIDDVLPFTGFDAIGIAATDLGIAIMLLLVNPYTIIPIITLVLFILAIRWTYIDLGRKIKIIEGINKSPVFTQLSTSLYGLTTIRAFRVEKRFENRFDIYANDHSSAWFFYISTGRWLLLYMDLVSVIFIGGITLSMLIMIDFFNEATIGLMISSALMFSGGFQWGMRQWTELETQMTSVDRVNEYSTLKSEGELESSLDKKPPENWPEKGSVEFINVTMRYFEDENPVLNNLNFKVEPSEKIGIVGRTGAGKSSIITALFRLTDFEGSILIDGIDTKEIGLHDLRKKIAIIPQEPVLFTGTIRTNLDPFSEHEDHQLWKVLQEIQLHKKVEEMNQGLSAPITDSGSNFSVGQKQLICLARAILRGNKILILDEATANCDPKTDELIQRTIRSVFDCTILTIAHRLNTVMDSSKILVMDAGELKDFDTPLNLINRKDSMFNQMIKATGREMARSLRKMAKEIELLRSVGAPRLELSEKIAETITVIEEDKDSDEDDELDLEDDQLNQILGNEFNQEIKKNNRESTHF